MTGHPTEYITENLAAVRAELAALARETGRPAPTLVAAVKYASDDELSALLDAGVTDVGENRVQQLLAHWPILAAHGARVHFIGTLQRNKVKSIIDKVASIQSLDTLPLAEEIERQAAHIGRTVPVLVEINSGREEGKSGVLFEEVEPLCRALGALSHLTLTGFMTMGPRGLDEPALRALFAETVRVGRAAWQTLGMVGEPAFSMGMSESFPAAVREGADYVRIGRRLFAGRPEQESLPQGT